MEGIGKGFQPDVAQMQLHQPGVPRKADEKTVSPDQVFMQKGLAENTPPLKEEKKSSTCHETPSPVDKTGRVEKKKKSSPPAHPAAGVDPAVSASKSGGGEKSSRSEVASVIPMDEQSELPAFSRIMSEAVLNRDPSEILADVPEEIRKAARAMVENQLHPKPKKSLTELKPIPETRLMEFGTEALPAAEPLLESALDPLPETYGEEASQ